MPPLEGRCLREQTERCCRKVQKSPRTAAKVFFFALRVSPLSFASAQQLSGLPLKAFSFALFAQLVKSQAAARRLSRLFGHWPRSCAVPQRGSQGEVSASADGEVPPRAKRHKKSPPPAQWQGTGCRGYLRANHSGLTAASSAMLRLWSLMRSRLTSASWNRMPTCALQTCLVRRFRLAVRKLPSSWSA